MTAKVSNFSIFKIYNFYIFCSHTETQSAPEHAGHRPVCDCVHGTRDTTPHLTHDGANHLRVRPATGDGDALGTAQGGGGGMIAEKPQATFGSPGAM